MDLSVQIDPVAIQKALVEAAARSAFGGEVEKVIKAEVERMCRGWDSPLQNVVRQSLHALAREAVEEHCKAVVEQVVKEQVTPEYCSLLLKQALSDILAK